MKSLITGGVIAFIALIMFFFFFGCERIDQGNIGLRVNLTGGDKGEAKVQDAAGWQFYMKGFTKIYEYPVFQQHKVYEPLDVPSKGGTIFTIHPSFNWNIEPDKVKEMFRRFRVDVPTLEEGYIQNALKVALREATNRFTVDSILNNLSIYDGAIQSEFQKRLNPYFTVTQFTSNITPDKKLADAISAKSGMVQEALKIESQTRSIRAQAENEIIVAKKDSTIKVVAAAADARSIQLKQQALAQSPQYIELIKAEKWDGHWPTTMLSGSTNALLNIK